MTLLAISRQTGLDRFALCDDNANLLALSLRSRIFANVGDICLVRLTAKANMKNGWMIKTQFGETGVLQVKNSTCLAPAGITGSEELAEGMLVVATKKAAARRGKGPVFSTAINLENRLCVFLPFSRGLKTSRKLDKNESNRICEMAGNPGFAELLKKGGCIFRRAAQGCEEPALGHSLDALARQWAQLCHKVSQQTQPGIIQRLDIVRNWLDNPAYSPVSKIVSNVQNDVRHLADESMQALCQPEPFVFCGVQEAIEQLCAPEAVLDNGGRLIFAATPACITVDVDQGRANNASQANIAACHALLPALELRSLGGKVVFEPAGDVKVPVLKRLVEILHESAAHHTTTATVKGYTRSGNIEIILPHGETPLAERLGGRCACCGQTCPPSPEFAAYNLFAQLQKQVAANPGAKFRIAVSPDLHGLLTGAFGEHYQTYRKTAYDISLAINPAFPSSIYDISYGG